MDDLRTMKAQEFYKQRSNSIRELWALSPKQIEYIVLIMEEYAALRQPLVSGEGCDNCGEGKHLICSKCYETESNFRESY